MKQGLTFHLSVRFDGLDTERVKKIEFIFEPRILSGAPKKETYPGTVTLRKGPPDLFLVPWSAAETYRFSGNFDMDTRITYKDTPDQPETPIVPLMMSGTLFEEDAQ